VFITDRASVSPYDDRMFLNFVKCFSLPLLILISVVLMTFPELRFHISKTKKITPETAQSIADLSFDQHYEIDQSMVFKVDIKNQDGRVATVLWPEEPYSTLLVLINYHDETLRKKTKFRGRLLRCPFQCLPNDMLVQMDEFHKLILESFPLYKNQRPHLPQSILNTTETPLDFAHYLKIHRWHYFVFAVSLILGILFFAWGLVKR